MFKVALHFYKEFFLVNLLISSVPGFVAQSKYEYGFPIFFLLGGVPLSIAYFEGFKKKQFYFYYNRGLTRPVLYLITLGLNCLAVTGMAVLIKLYLII